MVRAAVYIRVSTEEQAEEGFSLEAQQERLLAYCEAQGWEVAGLYADRGHTGRKISTRKEYQRMLEEREKWDMILVMKMDRIHRNSKNFIEMMDNLKKWDKEFTSMQEELDTSSAIGRFVVDMIQRIAQLESEQIGERTYMGMAQKAETGGLLGFYPPFGYRFKDNDLEMVEPEAEAVRSVYSDYLAGRSMSELSEQLNGAGVLTKRGNPWTVWAIRGLLHNPAYAGFRRWDGHLVKSSHPAIVPVEQYNAVQQMIARRTKNPRRRKPHELPTAE